MRGTVDSIYKSWSTRVFYMHNYNLLDKRLPKNSMFENIKHISTWDNLQGCWWRRKGSSNRIDGRHLSPFCIK